MPGLGIGITASSGLSLPPGSSLARLRLAGSTAPIRDRNSRKNRGPGARALS